MPRIDPSSEQAHRIPAADRRKDIAGSAVHGCFGDVMPCENVVVDALAARSIEVILAGQSAAGGFAASPTFSQYRDYSWFRDGSFIAEAMSRIGERESADRFFDWCAAIVRAVPAGPWDARYRLDGARDEVSWWPHRQFDGLGL